MAFNVMLTGSLSKVLIIGVSFVSLAKTVVRIYKIKLLSHCSRGSKSEI